MNFRVRQKRERTRVLLEILNLADGSLDLISMANQKGFKLIDHLDVYEKLLKSKYIKKK